MKEARATSYWGGSYSWGVLMSFLSLAGTGTQAEADFL